MSSSTHPRQKEVLDRLSRIEGHVHGLKRMVEKDKTCPEILIQIAAVRAALSRVSRIVLEDHVETCMKEAVKQGETDEYITELKEALSKIL
jgi:DNA-binding FrmR family transcriptional regulator